MDRSALRADCANCFGLCCVALRFERSSQFAISKPAGTPCPHLATDSRCTIHEQLPAKGFSGCVVYDCQGAGQKVSQVTFGGRDWRTDAALARRMFAAFGVVRQLHQMLAYLVEALEVPGVGRLRSRVSTLLEETERLSVLPPDELLGLDLASRKDEVARLLEKVSEAARRPRPGRSRRNADLVGANLRGADLRRQDLRGAYLIGADLRGADLRGVDLLAADLRGADLRGADLRNCLFLTDAQLAACRGDAATRLPERLTRPPSWTQ